MLPTPYWSFCILFDIFVYIILKSALPSCDIVVSEQSVRTADGEVNDILFLPEYIEPDVPEVSPVVSAATNRFDDDEEEIKVNEESLPLLRL